MWPIKGLDSKVINLECLSSMSTSTLIEEVQRWSVLMATVGTFLYIGKWSLYTGSHSSGTIFSSERWYKDAIVTGVRTRSRAGGVFGRPVPAARSADTAAHPPHIIQHRIFKILLLITDFKTNNIYYFFTIFILSDVLSTQIPVFFVFFRDSDVTEMGGNCISCLTY